MQIRLGSRCAGNKDGWAGRAGQTRTYAGHREASAARQHTELLHTDRTVCWEAGRHPERSAACMRST